MTMAEAISMGSLDHPQTEDRAVEWINKVCQ